MPPAPMGHWLDFPKALACHSTVGLPRAHGPVIHAARSAPVPAGSASAEGTEHGVQALSSF